MKEQVKFLSDQVVTCIPITPNCEKMLYEQVRQAEQKKPDLIEWRLDFFAGMEQLRAGMCPAAGEKLTAGMLVQAKALAGRCRLLLTLRHPLESGKERNVGGESDAKADAILPSLPGDMSILEELLQTGCADYVDIEMARAKCFIEEVRGLCERYGAALILSHHNFVRTPAAEQLLSVFRREEALGAEILKVAVMPQAPEDVQCLREAVAEYRRSAGPLAKPVIAISMGEYGKDTRLHPEYFGSCLTFVTDGEGTAPGQVSMEEYRQVAEMIQTR